MEEQTAALPEVAVQDAGTVGRVLPGFVELLAGEYGGELEMLVETTGSVTGCPACGVLATLHDRQPRWVRDLPACGRPGPVADRLSELRSSFLV